MAFHPATQQFCGDGACLVDRLIAVSQIQPVAKNAKQEWVGRSLQRWSDTTASVPEPLLEPLESASRRSSAAAKVASTGDNIQAFMCVRRGRKPSAPKLGNFKAQGTANHATVSIGYACPALAASPRPEALPLPMKLLRARSLSPPKDYIGAYEVQHLIRPVAA